MPAAVPLVVAGAVGTGVAASVGTAIAGAAIGTAAATAIGAGVIGAGTALATGQQVGDALKTGVTSGITAGIGSTIGAALGGTAGEMASIADEVYQGASGVVPAADAITAAEWFGGAGAATSPGAIFGSAAPSAGLLGGAAELASVGETMAPVASPSNVMEFGFPPTEQITPVPVDVIPGYATPENVFEYGYQDPGRITPAPADIIPASKISIQDALRGARLASNLLTPQQQQVPQDNLPAVPQGTVDYSQLLGLLSQRARGTGLLGTQFQPQPLNLASLLG